ncbi:MAG: SPOR domain-containing protein [SAR324 cluster bacterium]|nr:SPOR domain-containing protein [SAR324 cluster bacterium]
MQPHKKQKSYQVLLSGKQLLWISLLSFTSLVICFYLGFVSGKSSRPPLESSPISQQLTPLTAEKATLSPEKLSFFEMDSSAKEQEIQKKAEVFNLNQLEQLKQKTNLLQNEQKKRMETENTPSATIQKSEKPTIVKQQKPTSKEPGPVQKQPNPPLVEAKSMDFYTLQVFTSSDKEKAEMLVRRLKERGYLDAYLNPYTTTDKKQLYRVRVAKTDKKTVESLAIKIKKLDFIEHVQVTRL